MDAVNTRFNNWNAEGILRVHCGTKKNVFIRYALVIENYKVNCLNFNVFSQKILIVLVSSSKSGKFCSSENKKKIKSPPFWKYTFFLKLHSIKVSYNQNNIKYSRVNVQAQTGIIFLKFNKVIY
jgi:hypothetical protein